MKRFFFVLVVSSTPAYLFSQNIQKNTPSEIPGVLAGSCASPDGRFRDDPGPCSCVDASCGGDCATCLFGVCISCPCLGPMNYATANGDGNCYNNLTSGTYCYTYTQASSGYQYMNIVIDGCATCNGSSLAGGNYNNSNSIGMGCTLATYDENCTELSASNALHGSGNAGISVNELITICITVPVACSGTFDFCPVMRCSDNSQCGGNNGLPVNLLYVSAKRKEGSVEVSWETATEVNNDFYTLQRTLDGKHFEPIANIRGAGNSSSKLSYSFTDKNPYAGVYYYRLYQTDYDGKINYLGMVAVEAYGSESMYAKLITVFPNPATDNFHYAVYLPEDGLLVAEISDLSGKVLLSQKLDGVEGINETDLSVSGLSRGAYFLRIVSKNGTVSEKIFIE